MELSQQASDNVYEQNYETILEKEETLKETNEGWQRESERVRNNYFEDKKSQASGELNFNTNMNLAIIEGKKEAYEDKLIAVEEEEQENHSEQDSRIQISKEESAEKQKIILAYNLERREKNNNEVKDLASNELKDWESTHQGYVSDADVKLGTYNQKINDQQWEVYQFNQERKDNYSENQLKIEEKVEVLEEEAERLNQFAENKRQENKDQDFYQGEAKPRENRLAEKFPQGVTEEIIENQNNSTTIRRVVVEGTEVDVFEKTLYSWGGIFYTKNGANITKDEWDTKSK